MLLQYWVDEVKGGCDGRRGCLPGCPRGCRCPTGCAHGSLQSGSHACTSNLHQKMVCPQHCGNHVWSGCLICHGTSHMSKVKCSVCLPKTRDPRPTNEHNSALASWPQTSTVHLYAGWQGAEFKATTSLLGQRMTRWTCRYSHHVLPSSCCNLEVRCTAVEFQFGVPVRRH